MRKETYLTQSASDSIVFEGMTSLSAIINRNETNPENCRKIEKILFDSSKKFSKRRELDYLLKKSKTLGFTIEFSSVEELEHYTTGNTHGGIIAFCGERTIPKLDDCFEHIRNDGIYILLDGIEDPYNLGYAIRSIYAAGADGILLPERNWMTVAGIVSKSSAGASELAELYIAEPENALETMKKKGYRVVAAGIRDSVSMYDADLKKPVLLIVGGEKRGISASVLAKSDTVIRIDYGRQFRGSLSAASAATILSYEVFRQNR